jgi:DNA-binding NarL/FixJ family response regulator
VLIADADVPTRVGMRMILSSAGDIEVVGEVSRGDDAVAWAAAHQPDVVVMAVRLPGVNGIAAAARINAALGDRTRVVVLTSFDPDEYDLQARRAGASAFVSTHAGPDDLIGVVRAAAVGTQLPPPARAHPWHEPAAALPAEGLRFVPPLTSREREVLYLVGQGLSNVEIGAQLYISIETVRSHLRHIYRKSGVTNRTRLVVAAEANGFGDRTA